MAAHYMCVREKEREEEKKDDDEIEIRYASPVINAPGRPAVTSITERLHTHIYIYTY
ncbi:MAG: hypothetical protein ACI90V_003013 [Bacillariaceae sp.]|jgi:hypothetical protein